MGLDMYLTKKIYVGANYEHNNITGKISLKKGDTPINVNLKKLKYLEEEAGYWRKANQIHNWFVKNVQDGEDDCKDYYVETEKLTELLATCKKVKESAKLVNSAITNGYTFENGVKMPTIEEGKEIANPEIANELLPTGSGFFFGSTDYDEYYMQDIDDTIKIIEEALKDESAEYYYRSSW